MGVYVPYSQIAPKTSSLRELRAELDRVRQLYGPGSSQGAEAFNRLSREAGRQGQPLDGLRRYVEDEVERFFAQTIPGSDGHVYWDGGQMFVRNDSLTRQPRRWWWEHIHGPLGGGDAVLPTCGERHCINPEHSAKQDRQERHRRFTDQQMFGALQVVAMQLGHAPTLGEWTRLHKTPSAKLYLMRFGSWRHAVAQAGIEYRTRLASPKKCVAALRLARKTLGHWPNTTEFLSPRVCAALKEADLPRSDSSIYKHLGSWSEALRKAGSP